MSNAGRIFKSEKETYTDPVSGRKIAKLTKTGRNYDFYFSENSFVLGDKEIIYEHSDYSPSDKNYSEDFCLMNLESGESVQLTDLRTHFGKPVKLEGVSKSADGEYVVFVIDGDLYAFVRETGEIRLLYRQPVGYVASNPNVSFNNRYVVVALNEVPKYERSFSGNNDDGFLEQFYGQNAGCYCFA